ncbi:MAG: Uma2 family endonuclease [Pirellulaceae bacterium]
MSTARFHSTPLSVQDYLRGEADARQKHEYVDGVAYAMAGANNAHNTIATNATVSVGAQLRGNACRVFNSDTKVRIRSAHGTRFYYPDAMIACRLNPPDDTFQDAPVVIIEVISEATRRTDEHEKRQAYLSIDSLCAYIRVEQSLPQAVVDRRTDEGFITEGYAGLDAQIALPEIRCEITLSDLYEDIAFVSERTDDATR